MTTKNRGRGRALVPVVEKIEGTVIRLGDHEVTMEEIWRDAEVHPAVPGPWAVEADKYAWRDPDTGYGCIIRRHETDGHLGGYVGVPSSHPLFGWEALAIRALDILVHGGVSYSAECMHWQRHSRRICHVVKDMGPVHTMVHGVRQHDDLWWIGFECDRPYDALPRTLPGLRDSASHGSSVPVYRDAGYVFEQTRSLAAQLDAVARGLQPSDAERIAAPAVALDVSRTRSS